LKFLKIIHHKTIFILKWFFQNFNELMYLKIPLILFYFFGFNLIIFLFFHQDKDTTDITTSIFAIMATISAICFSWSKALDEKSESQYVNKLGERFFQSSLLFILASSLKYISINFYKNNAIFNYFLNEDVFKSVFNYFYMLVFSTAFSKAGFIFSDLNKFLWKKHGMSTGTIMPKTNDKSTNIVLPIDNK